MFEFGLYVKQDLKKAKMLLSIVLQELEKEGKEEGDLFYDNAMEGLRAINGENDVPLTPEFFEMLKDRAIV